jgi:branched-chain amino acid transport system substrate-binding protein
VWRRWSRHGPKKFGVAAVNKVPSPISESFSKDYTKRFKVHNTFEAILNYSALHIIAAAMEKAGTVDDPNAIKAAIPQVLPQDPKKVPAAYFGTLKTKLLIGGTVGVIEDTKYSETYQYIWISGGRKMRRPSKQS